MCKLVSYGALYFYINGLRSSKYVYFKYILLQDIYINEI